MILESVENGPIIWPTVKENEVARSKKYSELSATEAIQADYDVKVTNIILQGLPPDVYALYELQGLLEQLADPLELLEQEELDAFGNSTYLQLIVQS
nr:hypothetical protein [Tanacetum cinerariifolium]